MKFTRNALKFLPRFVFMLLFGLLAIKLASFFKCSFIFGASRAMFSGTTAAVPIVGLFGGGIVSIAIFAFSFLLRYALFGVSSLHVLAFYVPGLFASLYFAYSHILIRLVVPIVCMILFIVHPVGGRAFLYSFYWLIPIGIYFIRSKNIFLNALASTFVAHAVGSVIWLYTVPMSVYAWYALIPVVLIERLAISSAIVIMYKIVHYLKKRVILFLASREKIHTLHNI